MLSAVYIYHSSAEQLYVYHVAAYNEQEVFNKIYLYHMTDIVFNLIEALQTSLYCTRIRLI